MRGKSNWLMHRVRYYKSNAFWTPYSVYKLQRTFDNAAHKAVGKVLCTGRGPHLITALFNNMRTLKFKGQPTNAFSLTTIKCSADPPSLRLLPSTVSLSEQCTTIRLPHARQSAVGSRKLGGDAKHLIDNIEKHICRLTLKTCCWKEQ